MTTITRLDETRFRTLLERWNAHQALRSDGAGVPLLAASRWRLDDARNAVRS